MRDLVIVGGGASGMAAALGAIMNGPEASSGSECFSPVTVTVIEQNEKLGKKVYITGKGRCNVTNACDNETFFRNVVSNPKFLFSAFRAFSNEDVMDFLETNGCPLKTERGSRVFPVSDHASDVTKAFERVLKENGVQIRFRTAVRALSMENGRVTGLLVESEDRKKNWIPCDAVIIATGGCSYPLTGSTGDGYRFAAETGHEIKKPVPSLVSFATAESWPGTLAGLTLKNVSLSADPDGNGGFSEFGELLFTHNGISGPIVLTLSAFLSGKLNAGGNVSIPAFIDLKPALDRETLYERVRREFASAGKKTLKAMLSVLLPHALVPVVLSSAGIPEDRKAAEVRKEDRLKLVGTLKALPLTLTGTGDFREAIVTQGGVSVSGVESSTMRSKKIPNLFFAGELLDVDALTGGFNLQIAWSTGYLAGKSARKQLCGN